MAQNLWMFQKTKIIILPNNMKKFTNIPNDRVVHFIYLYKERKVTVLRIVLMIGMVENAG